MPTNSDNPQKKISKNYRPDYNSRSYKQHKKIPRKAGKERKGYNKVRRNGKTSYSITLPKHIIDENHLEEQIDSRNGLYLENKVIRKEDKIIIMYIINVDKKQLALDDSVKIREYFLYRNVTSLKITEIQIVFGWSVDRFKLALEKLIETNIHFFVSHGYLYHHRRIEIYSQCRQELEEQKKQEQEEVQNKAFSNGKKEEQIQQKQAS